MFESSPFKTLFIANDSVRFVANILTIILRILNASQTDSATFLILNLKDKSSSLKVNGRNTFDFPRNSTH